MSINRRQLLKSLGIASTAAAIPVSKAMAATCAITPQQDEGPFYPEQYPLDNACHDLEGLGPISLPAIGLNILIECVPSETKDENIDKQSQRGSYVATHDANDDADSKPKRAEKQKASLPSPHQRGCHGATPRSQRIHWRSDRSPSR